MVLCLKTINLRPTQEKTKKIAMVLCLKAINLRPTQEKIKKTTILGGSGHEIKGVADHFGGFQAWIPERSDFLRAQKAPWARSEAAFLRGPKAPRASWCCLIYSVHRPKGPLGPLGPLKKPLRSGIPARNHPKWSATPFISCPEHPKMFFWT